MKTKSTKSTKSTHSMFSHSMNFPKVRFWKNYHSSNNISYSSKFFPLDPWVQSYPLFYKDEVFKKWFHLVICIPKLIHNLQISCNSSQDENFKLSSTSIPECCKMVHECLHFKSTFFVKLFLVLWCHEAWKIFRAHLSSILVWQNGEL